MSRRLLAVVSDPADARWLEGEVVTADRYLEGGGEVADPTARVVNLCRSVRYRSKGYYVSLLASARGQAVVPPVETVQALADPYGLFRALAEEEGVAVVDPEEMQARRRACAGGDDGGDGAWVRDPEVPGDGPALRPARPEERAETLVCLGRASDPRFRRHAAAVYRTWPLPVFRLGLLREAGAWKVAEVAPVPLHRLREEERDALLSALRTEARGTGRGTRTRAPRTRASLAVLFDEEDRFRPSTPETLERLERVAARMGVYVRRIGPDELERLAEYDALFIRALTGVREPSFQFALRAEALGMPVVDDPQSIIRCTNKVFLEELLRREGIPLPRTLIVTPRTPWAEVEALGLPLVVKLPDGAFSAAVHRVGSRAEFRERSAEMFRRSPLLIAQEFLPTQYDWRVCVLGGRPLFVARYHMARGHWQIRAEEEGGPRYGRVEAVPRDRAPRPVVELALRAAALVGDGLYGVDLKETPEGPVVIEVNDNPNLDIGYDDAADGNAVYEDLVRYFLRRLEEGDGAEAGAAPEEPAEPEVEPLRRPIRRARPQPRHHRPFAVAGLELEYAVVDRDLNAVSRVEDAFRLLAGRATSDVDLGAVGFSNEIADHVFEVKTVAPVPRLADAEAVLAEGVARFSAVLREFDARLMPTGMHPWLDPRRARLWSRSNTRIYRTYDRLFDLGTHGWMNVHAMHLNLPMGREEEAVAMLSAAALLVPYLPALAASSPMHDGELQEAVDGRLAWILGHQARIPESQGEIVPEPVESFADYRRRILGPMYAALDAIPDAGALRREFFNARGAVFRFARRAMEVRVLDTQECVRMDVAVAAWVRAALKHLAGEVGAGRIVVPPHAILVADLRSTVRDGSRARVQAPHLPGVERAADGTASARDVLRALVPAVRRAADRGDAPYLELAERVVEAGPLSERIRAALLPHADDDEGFTDAARRLYIELMDCLEANEPWAGRWRE